MGIRKNEKVLSVIFRVFVVIFNSILLNEAQQAIVTQFGKPVGEPIVEAGLKFKFHYSKSDYFW